jgi:lipopolysaccharide transport system ATP-binding protein
VTDSAIKIENLGKLYRLGEVGTGTLSHDLIRWWHRVRGKEDPYLKIGQANDRAKKSESEYVWALRDINLEVKKGEVLGIIGRNGAGKSTLLKILSQVTSPTTGRVEVFGRIASLLEVGTGFHPELTGRENIFLNGAILGMRRHEIQKKFDEIVDFAGVEAYIDTPVKRYSSGMYVRLAFAVAAFLEPEILVVDEVLAVGDAEFQKKCLGRMKDVSVNEGRTVLFVSHNMAAIRNLCTKGLLIISGENAFTGPSDECVNRYEEYSSERKKTFCLSDREIPESEAFLKDFEYDFDSKSSTIQFFLSIETIKDLDLRNVGIGINNAKSERVTTLQMNDEIAPLSLSKGIHRVVCEVQLALNPGKYEAEVLIQGGNGSEDYIGKGSLPISIDAHSIFPNGRVLSPSQGVVQVRSQWKI